LVHARRDRLVAQVERARAGRAVAVDVVDGNVAESQVVEGTLSLAAHAVHVAGERLLELVGGHARGTESAGDRVLAEVGEIPIAALELRHADTDHAHFSLGHRGRSSSCVRATLRPAPSARKRYAPIWGTHRCGPPRLAARGAGWYPRSTWSFARSRATSTPACSRIAGSGRATRDSSIAAGGACSATSGTL